MYSSTRSRILTTRSLAAAGDVSRLFDDRVELERDADQALEQRVVQFAAEAHALAEHERELLAQLPHAKLPGRPDDAAGATPRTSA